ncbi:PBP1 and LysM peptidoglycan-binding domain-containing protein [Seonamhaeicola marinus]|uniref:LysM peptidoglycan-binding domain-containing protein n=1 Tax=Seonamhaeicola marinus TaxID=1912246 RepID=A0A5D0HJH8_9FLAO|nr:LysM peptidoglycan-binding domain-containing protein [Seonamhaeicola marinus]TYA71544.1 LysM peptidoglycan-binding domain-containing protein [Seonamhaeicola marinus]
MTKFFTIFCFLCLFSFNLVSAQDKHSIHRVKEGETVEGIAKRYFVTPFDIYRLNPEAKKELKPNTILIIPKSEVEKKVTIVKELEGFKTHKTKRKETLYSLAKKYNVEENDIKKHNTFLYANPLRKGDKLQIPVFKTTEVVEEVELYKPYIVQPKEGKWRVAYKFGITVAELEAMNPEMGEVLQEGQEIKVPNLEKEHEKEIDEQFSYYKVLPKEGFYRLKVKLGLEKEELEELNPGLAESGLKVGMILKIPFNEATLDGEEMKINLSDSISDYNTKHIAVMLPFRLNRVDFDSISGTKKSIKKDPYLNVSLDFHSGVLMAVDSLQRLGISLKVDVYDTKNQESEVLQILENNDFETVDAVIGPLMSKTFEKASSELRSLQVPIVSPIGSKLKLYDNVFQSRASSELLNSKLINFVKADTLVENIIIISDSKHVTVSNSIKQEFAASKQVFSRKDKKTGEDQYFIVKTDIEDVLTPGNNVVFLETKDTGFVSNVTSVLASLIQKEDKETETEERNITLVTTNFNKAFEDNDISNEHLSKLQFCYATTSKSYELDNAFVKRYKEKYHITPNKRAVKGFDLTMDVVLRLVTSEDLFMSVNEAPVTEYVENKFAYKKKLFGGYFNDTVYLVKHQDLQIVEVKQQ